MKLEDLRKPWRDKTVEAATPVARDQLVAQNCRRVERFWAVVFRRDMIETAAATLVMYWFTKMAWSLNASPLERIGAWVVVAGAVYVVYRLHAARLGKPPEGIDAPVRDFCRTELARVETQIHLLKTVLLWYLGPIMVGLTLMSHGRFGFAPGFFLQLAIFAALTWGIHAMNQYAVRKQLEPLRDNLVGLLDELDSEEGSS